MCEVTSGVGAGLRVRTYAKCVCVCVCLCRTVRVNARAWVRVRNVCVYSVSVCTHICTCFGLYMPMCMSRTTEREAECVSLWKILKSCDAYVQLASPAICVDNREIYIIIKNYYLLWLWTHKSGHHLLVLCWTALVPQKPWEPTPKIFTHLNTTSCSLYMLMLCSPSLFQCKDQHYLPCPLLCFWLSGCLYGHPLCCRDDERVKSEALIIPSYPAHYSASAPSWSIPQVPEPSIFLTVYLLNCLSLCCQFPLTPLLLNSPLFPFQLPTPPLFIALLLPAPSSHSFSPSAELTLFSFSFLFGEVL